MDYTYRLTLVFMHSFYHDRIRLRRLYEFWRASAGETISSFARRFHDDSAEENGDGDDNAPQDFSELSYPFPVKSVELPNGARLAYIDEGARLEPNAETIVFLHGLGSYLPAWSKNAAALRERYRCVALDFPGYGRSAKRMPDGSEFPYSMRFFADTVVELLDALNIYKATLCGHSMGGQVALTAALERPERVKRLVLIAPAGFEGFSESQLRLIRDAARAEDICASTESRIRASYKLNFYSMPPDAEAMLQDRLAMRRFPEFELYCQAVAASVLAMADAPVRERLGEIRQPALILFGENDALIPNPLAHALVPADVARDGASRITGSRLELIPKAGHFLQFEKPDEVNRAIQEFVG